MFGALFGEITRRLFAELLPAPLRRTPPRLRGRHSSLPAATPGYRDRCCSLWAAAATTDCSENSLCGCRTCGPARPRIMAILQPCRARPKPAPAPLSGAGLWLHTGLPENDAALASPAQALRRAAVWEAPARDVVRGTATGRRTSFPCSDSDRDVVWSRIPASLRVRASTVLTPRQDRNAAELNRESLLLLLAFPAKPLPIGRS